VYLENCDWLVGAGSNAAPRRWNHEHLQAMIMGMWLGLPMMLLDFQLSESAGYSYDVTMPLRMIIGAFLFETMAFLFGGCMMPSGYVPEYVMGFRLGCACNNWDTPYEACDGGNDAKHRPAMWYCKIVQLSCSVQ
jgi:hypothetical protein